jgi:hypothetical protein
MRVSRVRAVESVSKPCRVKKTTLVLPLTAASSRSLQALCTPVFFGKSLANALTRAYNNP